MYNKRDWVKTGLAGLLLCIIAITVVSFAVDCANRNITKTALEEVQKYTQMECKVLGYVDDTEYTAVYYCTHAERKACFYVVKYFGEGVAIMNAAPCFADTFEKE